MKTLKIIVWIIGLPLRIVFGIGFLIIISMLTPNDLEKVARSTWEGVKGKSI